MRPPSFSDADYAELLGLYLGDGHVSAHARTQRLRVCLDTRCPAVVDEADALLRRCFPENALGRVLFHDGAEAVLHVYWAHLSCLLPQHGPAKKHARRVLLEACLRGCIRSDGCVFNRTGRYAYLSY